MTGRRAWTSGSQPVLLTTGFMAPEAYTIEAIITAWAGGLSNAEINAACPQHEMGRLQVEVERLKEALQDIIEMSVRDEFGLKGDINDDDTVDLFDLILALQILSGLNAPAYLQADTNGDSRVDMADAVYLLQIIGGK